MRIETRLKLSLAAIFAIMLFVAWLPFHTNHAIRQTSSDLRTTITREQNFDRLVSLLQAAETGQRGYIITGKENFLVPYQQAIEVIPGVLKALEDVVDITLEEQQAIREISHLVDLKLSELAETIALRHKSGFSAVEPIVSSERGKNYMDELKIAISAQVQRSLARRNDFRTRLQDDADKDLYAAVGIILLNILFLTLLMRRTVKTLRERELLGAKLRSTANDLATNVQQIEQRNALMHISTEMLQALTAVGTIDETAAIFSTYCTKLLPCRSGAMYLYRNSRDMLQMVASWGQPLAAPDMMEPTDCWALQRGQCHQTEGSKDLCCAHYAQPETSECRRLCCPLVAHGEVIGMLYIESPGIHDEMPNNDQQFIMRLTEQIALAISNVKLREALRRQSIIDPLTGLYNRRYLDETLKRELSRAERNDAPLSIVLLDLDHFKNVNDVYGHDVGDLLLKETSKTISSNIRRSDLACRFGGEELVVLLPDCDTENAIQRAETLRAAIAQIKLRDAHRQVDGISASFGVASYPKNGKVAEDVLRAADQAMYQAKKSGRNRVLVANV